MMIVFSIVLTKTKFGLLTYAQGSIAKSALMSGVKQQLVRRWVCDLRACAGVAAAFVAAKNFRRHRHNGQRRAFQAIAACVVGGLSWAAAGSAIGAFLGGMFMQLILTGFSNTR
jgi:ribose/xylose/arabinose/galactoside ABC-type transport system permease subunit